MKQIIDTLNGLATATDLFKPGVRILWMEVFQNARAFMKAWIVIVSRIAHLSEENLSDLIKIVVNDSMPLGRVDFVESYDKLTYELILDHFDTTYSDLRDSLHDILYRIGLPPVMKSKSKPTWTGRPFPEILAEAILRSTYNKSGSKALWLRSLQESSQTAHRASIASGRSQSNTSRIGPTGERPIIW